FDEASDRELQRGEDCGAPGADILSDGAFALGQLAILIKYFDQDFHWNYVATLFSLLSKRNFRNTFGRILSDGPKPDFSAVTGNLVSPGRIFFKASRWTLANKGHSDFNHRAFFSLRIKNPNVSHHRPDPIMIFDVVKAAQLSRHGQGQKQ